MHAIEVIVRFVHIGGIGDHDCYQTHYFCKMNLK